MWRGWRLGVVSEPSSSAEDGKGWAMGLEEIEDIGWLREA